MGLLEILKIFVNQTDQTEFTAREPKAKYIQGLLRKTPGARQIAIVVPEEGRIRSWLVLTVLLDEQRLAITAEEVVGELYWGGSRILTCYGHNLCRGREIYR